jgi:hypothetical protein
MSSPPPFTSYSPSPPPPPPAFSLKGQLCEIVFLPIQSFRISNFLVLVEKIGWDGKQKPSHATDPLRGHAPRGSSIDKLK